MTRLLALFAVNPLILIGAVLAIFAFGVSTGGSAAWWAQGVRITAEQQKLTKYQQEQTRIFQEAKDAADLERVKTSGAYERASKALADSIQSGAAYRRCVAAGKCGVRVCDKPTCATGIRLPSADRVDASGTDPIPIGTGATAEDPVVGDCAKTTLMLNSLQADIENQPGFKE